MIKNTKRILAIMLAFAVIAMSMFTGFVVSAAGETQLLSNEGVVDLLEFGDYLVEAGSASKWWDNKLADNGETGADWENAIIIDSAEEFVYLCKASGDDTKGLYYKVADGIAGFDLTKGDIDYNGTLADNIDKIKAGGKNHAGGTPGFQGHFDGNGVTVYGAWTNDTWNEDLQKYNTPTYAGLFSCTKGNVTIKNINVNKAYFAATTATGGIVGYYDGDGTTALTIENCSVTDSYLKSEKAAYGAGTGAIVGFAKNYTSAGNGPVTVKNCYVNLNEANFISACEDAENPAADGAHGGVLGFVVSNYTNGNAGNITDCVVIGIKPYSTTTATANNNVQHSGLETHYANIYTTSDVAITDVNLGGNGGLGLRNYTGRVFPLTDAQLKGAAATENMNLDWSVWMADDEGYPELASSHKNVTLVNNGNGTHAATCACGFGGIAVDCTYVDGTCACGAELTCDTRKTITWDGTKATGIATGTGTKDDPYIIKTAAEFAWLVSESDVDGEGKHNSVGKYYEIDKSIGKIVLQPADAEAIIALKDAAAVKAYFETGAHTEWIEGGWETQSFAGNFNGNGVTVYGLYSVSGANAGLFNTIDAGAVIKNIALKNSYLKSEAGIYQVGGIAAVTSADTRGAKTVGAVWFDSCVVANNYMYNKSDSHDRSGVIIGSSSDVVYIDNCLVYGNDATYGSAVAMPVWSNGNNSKIVADDFVAPEGLVLVDDGAETPRYYNMIRNSIIFGAAPYDVAQQSGSRFNDPKCFVNVLTDAASGEVAFANKSNGEPTKATFSDEQIKNIAVADLATAELGAAWIKTDSYPELASFHDAEFTTVDNGDGTHSSACSCGVGAGAAEAHTYVEGVCSCGNECAHTDTSESVENETKPTCTVDGSHDKVVICNVCGVVVSRETVTDDALGHTDGEAVEESRIDSTCTTPGSHDMVTYCTVCGEETSRVNEALELDPNNHTYDNADDAECNDCGAVRELYISGDINDDGAVNNRDAVLLQQHLAEWDVTINEAAADVYDDGKNAINNKDYVRLVQYLADWDVTLD